MNVISICSQKGGVSKTTTTIEMAAILHSNNKRVLVIDLDQQCSLTKNVGGDLTKASIYEVLHADIPINEAIQHLALFDLLSGSESLSRADREFVDIDDVFILQTLISLVKDEYDYVFIDNSPSRSVLLTMTYIACDYIVIPTECDESSKDSLVTTQRDVLRLVNGRHHDSHAKIIGYILTKYENTTLHAIALDDLETIANENPNKPFVKTIRKSIKASEAKSFHTSTTLTNGTLPIASDYMDIYNEIIKRVEEE